MSNFVERIATESVGKKVVGAADIRPALTPEMIPEALRLPKERPAPAPRQLPTHERAPWAPGQSSGTCPLHASPRPLRKRGRWPPPRQTVRFPLGGSRTTPPSTTRRDGPSPRHQPLWAPRRGRPRKRMSARRVVAIRLGRSMGWPTKARRSRRPRDPPRTRRGRQGLRTAKKTWQPKSHRPPPDRGSVRERSLLALKTREERPDGGARTGRERRRTRVSGLGGRDGERRNPSFGRRKQSPGGGTAGSRLAGAGPPRDLATPPRRAEFPATGTEVSSDASRTVRAESDRGEPRAPPPREARLEAPDVAAREPVVTINIGRIEVRAVNPERPPTEERGPSLSLEEYMKRRDKKGQ